MHCRPEGVIRPASPAGEGFSTACLAVCPAQYATKLSLLSLSPMPKITQANVDDQSNAQPERRKALLQSLQFVDAELQRLQAQAAVLQTARLAYAQELAALDINSPAGTTAGSAAAPGAQPALARAAGPIAAPSAAPANPLPDRPKVLLVTYQWSTLAEVAYLAKQAGCHVDVLCPSANSAIKNSFYDHWIDSGASMETLLDVLRKLAGDKIYQYILIGDDPILWRVYRDKIDDLWHLLPVLNQSALPILGKIGFAEHCREHGIVSPRFHPVRHRDGASEALQSLGLPVVVKENYSNGGAGVRILQDESSYFEFMAGYGYAEPLLVQQFIGGEQLGVDALFKHGKLLQYACSVDVEPTLGPSTKRRYFPNDEQLGALISQLGRSALLHGFVNVSILRDATSQRCYLIEADPRPTKWVTYAKWFGHDFVPAFQKFLADGESDDAVPDASYEDVDCWEVEYFPNHAAKLLNEGRTAEAIRHLLDFKRNYRHTIYDPVLLEYKMDCILRGLKFE
jgi:predicted ATP-grasp superfamily ATP-dependent carboligase